MRLGFVLASALLLLTGCGVVGALEQMDAAADRKQCRGFGFAPGTDAFSNCMMQQSAQRSNEDQRVQDRMALDEAVRRSKRK